MKQEFIGIEYKGEVRYIKSFKLTGKWRTYNKKEHYSYTSTEVLYPYKPQFNRQQFNKQKRYQYGYRNTTVMEAEVLIPRLFRKPLVVWIPEEDFRFKDIIEYEYFECEK